MEFLDKLTTRKNLSIFGIVVGVLAGFIGIMAKDQSSLLNMLSTFIAVYYILLVAAIALCGLSIFYFVKKANNKLILANAILAGGDVLFLLLGHSIIKIFKSYTSGDWGSLMGYAATSSYDSIQSAANNIGIAFYIGIAILILNVVLLLMELQIIKTKFEMPEEKAIQTDGESAVTFDSDKAKEAMAQGADVAKQGAEVAGQAAKQGAEVAGKAAKEGMAKAQSFFKTKNGKITLGAVAVVIVAFVGYKIWDDNFNKTTIDLLPKPTLEVSGDDGEGYITDVKPGNIQYDESDAELASFVKDVYYDYDYSNKLSNGDKVKVTAVYNKTTADSLKLEVKNTTAELEVKGLTEQYTKAKDVPAKIKKQIEKDLESEMADSYDNSTYRSYTYAKDSMYFVAKKGSDRDYAVAVYKVEETSTYGSTPETETYYAVAYVSGVDSEYLDDNHYAYTSKLYDGSYNALTDASQIETAIQKEFKGYTLTKF